MKRSLALVLVLAGVLAGAATAKGPVAATITGPGLGQAIVVGGDAEGNVDSVFGRFVQQVGFFPQVFTQTPDSTSRVRPQGALGPRYDVAYRVPGPNNETWTVWQELYPFAASGPVTYIRPGQTIFTSMKTHGGWYRSPLSLPRTLVSLGFPSRPAAVKQSGLGAGAWTGIGIGAALLLSVAWFVMRRRSSGETPA